MTKLKYIVSGALFLLFTITAKSQCLDPNGIGYFEDPSPFTNWFNGTQGMGTISVETSDVYSGTQSVNVDVTTDNVWQVRMLSQGCPFDLVVGQYYTVNVYLKGPIGNEVGFTLMDGSTSLTTSSTFLTSTDWQLYEVVIPASVTTSNGAIRVNFYDTGTHLMDNLIVIDGPTFSSIPLTDPNICLEGAIETEITGGGELRMFRFLKSYATSSPAGYYSSLRATSSAGIKVSLKTTSPYINISFSEDLTWAGDIFFHEIEVYKNGVYQLSTNDFDLSLTNTGGSSALWEFVLPVYTQMNIKSIELVDGHSLESGACGGKPVYVAIGNSITMGVGTTNNNSSNSYSYLVADSLEYELQNWGIGGSKIYDVLLDNLNSGIDPSLITMLWGFNDVHYSGNDSYLNTNSFPQYEALLDTLCKQFPSAKVLAILPTYTNDSINTASRTIPILRDGELSIIQNLQLKYNNLCYIDGREFTDPTSLSDDVHLNDAGNVSLANGILANLNGCQIESTDTLVLRSEYEKVNDVLTDLNFSSEGSGTYSIVSGNTSNNYQIDGSTGILTIQNTITDVIGGTKYDTLQVSNSGEFVNVIIVDAYDYFLETHPEYIVLDEHQETDSVIGNPYTAYNNLWGKGTATPNVDFRMATLVHPDFQDSTVFIWDVPSKADVFGGPSVWSYVNLIYGNRKGQREDLNGFPFQLSSVDSLILSFDFEQLFGTDRYKIALNHFLTDESDIQPFSANDGDFFMVFDQIGTWVPPYPVDLGDTVIEGKTFSRLYDINGAYEYRRIIIKNNEKWLNGAVDLNGFYKNFMDAGYLDSNQYIPNIQLGIEITEGWGAVRFNKVDFNLVLNNTDCNGDVDGTASIDNCSVCSGGNTGVVVDECLTPIDQIDNNMISVYPNPTEGIIHISAAIDWIVYNGLGEMVLSGNGDVIRLNDNASGIYLIVVGEQIFKITKQ